MSPELLDDPFEEKLKELHKQLEEEYKQDAMKDENDSIKKSEEPTPQKNTIKVIMC